jgi:hypothetical protein
LEKVFRISATFTVFAPELLELPVLLLVAAAAAFELLVLLLELLEPQAATVSAAATAQAIVATRRERHAKGPSGRRERRSRDIKTVSSSCC